MSRSAEQWQEQQEQENESGIDMHYHQPLPKNELRNNENEHCNNNFGTKRNGEIVKPEKSRSSDNSTYPINPQASTF